MSFELAPVLEFYSIDFNPDRTGNQKIRCPSPLHEDREASCSVNLDEGVLQCFGCLLRGDAVSLIEHMEGLDNRGALKRAEELSRETGDPIQRGVGRDNSYLPSRQGHRPGRRQYSPSWRRKRP